MTVDEQYDNGKGAEDWSISDGHVDCFYQVKIHIELIIMKN